MQGYKSEGTNIECEDEVKSVTEQLEESMKDFGADFRTLPVVVESYYPTRLEYFAGKALQGLVTGQAEKQLRTSVKRAVQLAQEMEELFDNL